MPRASSSTASSRRRGPSEPEARSGQMTRRAPTWPGPEMTVATATGSCFSIDSATWPSSGKVSRETGSTRMSMMPPQVSPTENASSSLTPYRCRTGARVWVTSVASSNTAPSTQPPDTLPTTSWPCTAMAAPGGLGALLKVATTVASPNSSPDLHQDMISGSTSRMGEPFGEFLVGGQAVPGHQSVEVGQGGPHAAGERLVIFVPFMRVYPDYPVCLPGEPGHLRAQQLRVPPLPAVGGDDRDRAARAVAAQELLQLLPQPGAAAPVGDGPRHRVQGGAGVAVAQLGRDGGQPGA